MENNNLQIKFIDNCVRADLIPCFLKFWVPNNGCFDNKSVHDFQKGLLRKELVRARQDLKSANERLYANRQAIKNAVPEKLLPSIILHTRIARRTLRSAIQGSHSQKLLSLSEEQERPLFNVKNAVILYGLEKKPPHYVMETLSLGAKNAVIEKFQPKDVLTELDGCWATARTAVLTKK